ncbi:hypothetical protein [Primorskyibacter marinus]|uniref:hypothetical protein n=1 Tax=Primorskyibacter marinus TaxID=1977320 RepID=UPI000E2FF5EF|nr:hypothetical protein [Primorskyibacter marinus]
MSEHEKGRLEPPFHWFLMGLREERLSQGSLHAGVGPQNLVLGEVGFAEGMGENSPAGIAKLIANREECRLGTGQHAE